MILITLNKVLYSFAALLPEPEGALLGKVKPGSDEYRRMAAEAARTIPGWVPLLETPFCVELNGVVSAGMS